MSSALPRALRPNKVWIVVGLVVLLVGLYAASRTSSEYSLPFDPESTKPDGTLGLVELLEHFDVKTSISDEPQGSAAILFYDDLTEGEASRVQTWVRRGGTLVIADPYSQFTGTRPADPDALRQPRSLEPNCDSPFVDGIQRIEPEDFGRYAIFEQPPLTTACFAGRGGDFMVEEPYGSGTIVMLGAGEIFTNKQLGKADNSVLAMNLLAPDAGASVTFLQSEELAAPTTGDATVSSLIPSNTWELILQLVIAGFVLMFWRARRIGLPVEEPQLVELPGSQLTVATGNLLQNGRQTDAAAATLRADLRRTIADLIGMTADTDPYLLASAVSDRTGADKDRILQAIVDQPVEGSRGLVDLARIIESVHREVANAR